MRTSENSLSGAPQGREFEAMVVDGGAWDVLGMGVLFTAGTPCLQMPPTMQWLE